METKKRIVSMDLIRLFACICVTVVHFNASVSGWNNGVFVYPNSIIPNYYLEGRVYLADIGVSLFFMLSGASLMLTYKKGNLWSYFKKRFLSIFPMLWLAYLVAFSYDFMYWKGMTGQNILYWIFSFLGLDGYLAVLGLIPGDFFKVGEWFTGCILILYLIFPLLHFCLEKKPKLTLLCSCAVYACYIACTRIFQGYFSGVLFFLRIPEMVMGMLFIQYDLRHKPKILLAVTGIAAGFAIVLRSHINSLTLCIAVCMLLFAVLTFLGEKIENANIQGFLSKAAGLTYPVFLIHHWLISHMVIGFDLANMPKRSVAMMFLIYLFLTIFLSCALKECTRRIMARFRKN